MSIKKIPLSLLLVNRGNDRHGELENETAAIAWLFNAKEIHMRNLAKDITQEGGIYELPLVAPEFDKFLVFDGNRRVTCLKLIVDPRRAPTTELQAFFEDLKQKWANKIPLEIQCQVEADRDRIDEILFRRHTGSQGGIGQSTWDDRMKRNFVDRSGKESGVNVADQVEIQLRAAHLLPARNKIPRSTLKRLLSSELYRNRVGFSMSKTGLIFTHEPAIVLGALSRITNDMVSGKVVLGKIWDVDGKTDYLNALDAEGVLPKDIHLLPSVGHQPPAEPDAPQDRPGTGDPGNPIPDPTPPTPPKAKPTIRLTLIPQKAYGVAWPGRLQRHHQIWEELQFHLQLSQHPNAISVLFRVLLELSIDNYIQQKAVVVHNNDHLAVKALKVAEHQFAAQEIDQKMLGIVKKFQNMDQLVSADTLNRYVHSPNFAPSTNHLTSLWDSLSQFVVACLEA
ncbi:hypothetical protein [Asticcacaulis sp.]|uniref:hypothetical protein n=1 Tax=Asticcacaulis sp. TaxID=1872648 RepID=UPI002BA4E83D|nr:hypothetical protein [Asticcacaulis sp.]HTM81925.1 hypothetical protein [Asticcacaulis sp.]